MKILITGFEPFGGEKVNPAYEAVRLLPDKIGTAEITKLEVPTVQGKSLELIGAKLREIDADVVLSVGQKGGATAINIERIAVNIDDYSIPDNDGNQPAGVPIFADGPAAYFSNLPVREMRDAVTARKIPAVISNSAGTYVCNHVFYGVRHIIETEYPGSGRMSGFIHVPYIPEQTADKPAQPSMALADIAAALAAIIEEIAG